MVPVPRAVSLRSLLPLLPAALLRRDALCFFGAPAQLESVFAFEPAPKDRASTAGES
jgi:hypothetical protein